MSFNDGSNVCNLPTNNSSKTLRLLQSLNDLISAEKQIQARLKCSSFLSWSKCLQLFESGLFKQAANLWNNTYINLLLILNYYLKLFILKNDLRSWVILWTSSTQRMGSSKFELPFLQFRISHGRSKRVEQAVLVSTLRQLCQAKLSSSSSERGCT